MFERIQHFNKCSKLDVVVDKCKNCVLLNSLQEIESEMRKVRITFL